MMNVNNIAASDAFSWKRVLMVGRFYGPALKKQLLIYAAATLIFFILSLMPFPAPVQIGVFSMIWTALGFMTELSPIVLAKSGDSRVIERLLPASAAEKYVFYLIYFLVIIPIVVYTLPKLALYLYALIPAIQHKEMLLVIDIQQKNPLLNVIMNSFSTLAGTVTCLLVVLSVKHNRTLMGILSVFAVMIGAGIIGAIYGMTQVFYAGYIDGLEGRRGVGPRTAEEILGMIDQTPGFTIAVTCLFAAYCFYILWRVYKTVKSKNL